MNALNRRVSGLEEDLETTEEKLVAASAKLDKAGTAADDSERAKKVFQNKAEDDDKRITILEKELKEAREFPAGLQRDYVCDCQSTRSALCDALGDAYQLARVCRLLPRPGHAAGRVRERGDVHQGVGLVGK